MKEITDLTVRAKDESGWLDKMMVENSKVTLPALQKMKREKQKIVAVVVWDYQIAQIVDRVGVDIISVGDSVGVNLWGHTHPLEVTLEEMLVVCKAVRRGVRRSLLSCDLPYGPLQEGTTSAVRAAIRLVKEAGADMIKLDGAAAFPDAVHAFVRAGIPVFAQFGITPQTALQSGIQYSAAANTDAQISGKLTTRFIEEAVSLEEAGASLLDFTNSGPVVGAAVVPKVSIPVIGGFGGGPWLDGRIRMAHAAIGYAAGNVDADNDNYANVAKTSFEAIARYAEDVRAGQQIRGVKIVSPQTVESKQ